MIVEGHQIEGDLTRSCDVCIIGSGAGGAVLAASLAARGLDVVVLEEGGYHQRSDFAKPDERWSYPALYQERGGRTTDDLSITILQGRAVGGTTVVNWTTCFRTPERILAHWRSEHGTTLDSATLAPHFEAVEARLNIHPWPVPPNGNNDVLRRGCEALGWEHDVLRRNVKGCASSGMCGLGCPVDAKQAMHLTYLVDAVGDGATVYADVRVDRLEVEAGRVKSVQAVVMQRGVDRPTPTRVTITPKVVVSSCGAINGPALFLRSGLDGGGRVGRRTFIHPVVAVLAEYEERIQPFYGAPQSVSSHEFVDRGPDQYGFFLEAAPLQPMLAASAGWVFGETLDAQMQRLPHLSVVIALHVDGLLAGDEGGTVTLKGDRPSVSYPVGPRLQAAMKDAHVAAARVHLAAGAKVAFTTHPSTVALRTVEDLALLEKATYGTHQHGIFTAHQMGGLSMGADPAHHPVDPGLRFRGVDNVFVVDGSVLPTALGVNPSETIYGLAHWAADGVAAAV
ncbi:MAG: GMC family oxidoreductase [Myxococcota bacterium]